MVFCLRNPREREALAGSRISIVGCGSFGSALADMLVRAGVGHLTLIDPEPLSIENVGRHVLTAREVGEAKVHALARRFREINPALDVDARQEKFRDAAGLLVCCADSRRCESMVNAVSLARNLPAVYVAAYGAVHAGEVQVCVPGQTACRECFARFRPGDELAARPESYTDPDFDATRTPGQSGLWGSILAIAGIAFHVILKVIGIRDGLDLQHPLWIVNLDYEGFQPYAVTFAKVPQGCPVCDESKVQELQLDDAGPLRSSGGN